jgi:phenylacetate-CoA ligase
MEKLSLVKKSINAIQIRALRNKKSKHSALVSLYINHLHDYHIKDVKFDFSIVREELLKDILLYASKNTAYYKEILPGSKQIASLSDAKFRKIPFLTKDLIRENLNALISDIVPRDCLAARKTGGTTGDALAFWSSGSTDDIHQKFLFEIYNYKPGQKILALDGTFIEEQLTEKKIFWTPKNRGNMLPYGGMALSSLYLTKETIPFYVDFILSYTPDFIRGYPGFVTEIAEYIVSNNIQVDFEMKGIELTSESFASNQVRIIRKAFHTKVFGQYGHTEASVFGYTLDDSFEYYCSPLYGLTEVINSKNENVEIGEEGEIVVTGFSNYGMPIIRYRTGDRAIYGGDENGIVKLKNILGRTTDYLVNELNDRVSITALLAQHYDSLKNISQWQIVQDKSGEVTINIHKLEGYCHKDEAEIEETFYHVARIKCNFIYDKEFVKTKAGKMKFVIQNVIV